MQFKTVHSSSTNKDLAGGSTYSMHDSLIDDGTNGRLEINDIRFIVDKFKLEPGNIEEEEDSLDSEVEEFETDPFFIYLPLAEDTLNLGDTGITAGLYEELEFEVKDLDFDDGDEKDAGHQALADTIRNTFPDWPDVASMVLTGTFTPDGGLNRSKYLLRLRSRLKESLIHLLR